MDGRGGEAAEHDSLQLGGVGGDATAGTAQCVGRPDDQRVADPCREAGGLRERGADERVGHRLTEVLEQPLEGVPVLRHPDRGQRRAQHADPEPIEDARLGQLDREVETGLAAEGGQDRVRPLALDDRGHRLNGQGLDVDAVGHLVVGHDRGRVGVDEHRLDALLAERPAGLAPGVVELGRLADHDRAGADDEHLARLLRQRRPGDRPAEGPGGPDHLGEAVEEVLVVLRAGRPLGVVLHAEDRQAAMGETLDGAVVEVQLGDEEVARRDAGGLDLELVVLARDVGEAGLQVLDGVVGAMMSEGQPRGLAADRLAEQLVAEADAEEWDPADRLPAELHRPGQHRRVAGPVGEDQPVGPGRLDLLPAAAVRQDDDPEAARAERAEDVRLHPVVDDGDGEPGGIGAIPAPELGRERLEPLHRAAAGDRGDEVLLGQRRHPASSLGEFLQPGAGGLLGLVAEHRPKSASGAQVAGQGPGVDAVDARDPMPLEVAVERVEGAEAARPAALPADDERPHPRLLRLGVGVVDAVVALQRVGHADHLPGIGGIGQHLLVAAHRGVEDHLALAQRVGAEGFAGEGPAVLQDQGGEALHE